MLAVVAESQLQPRRRLAGLRVVALISTALFLLLAVLTLIVWWRAPVWLAPVDDFAQGPGGAVAYVTIANQIREQSAEFWTGGDVRMELNEEEFSGMLSSALLTGRRTSDPLQRVRGSLIDDEIKVEAILRLPADLAPDRLSGPIGLRLRLNPVVTEQGLVQFQITRVYAGRIPIPPALIRLAGRVVPIQAAGFQARDAVISLPLGDMISRTLGRKLEIKQVSATDKRLQITVAMPNVRK